MPSLLIILLHSRIDRNVIKVTEIIDYQGYQPVNKKLSHQRKKWCFLN